MKKVLVSRQKYPNLVEITPPPSKSHTMRALLFAALSNEQSVIFNGLSSNDTKAMIKALESMGVKIDKKENTLWISGIGEKLYDMDSLYVDAQNSGIILRFVTAVASLSKAKAIITGDNSIQNLRNIAPLIHAIEQRGGKCKYLKKNGFAPFEVQGPIQPGVVNMQGEDSQYVSAMLIACAFLKEKSIIYVNNPKEIPWIDLTLYWLNMLNAKIENDAYKKYVIEKPLSYTKLSYHVPTDFSSTVFLIAAALICKVKTIVKKLDFEDVQGDKIVIDHLIYMNGLLTKDRQNQQLIIESSPMLSGGTIDMDGCIDALPILAVLGCFMKNKLVLLNCKGARSKESNRLEAITSELKKMGANIHCDTNKVEIYPSLLFGANVKSYNDHRIAMALSVAALNVQSGYTIIEDTDCIAKTYPQFFRDLQKFGANIRWIET